MPDANGNIRGLGWTRKQAAGWERAFGGTWSPFEAMPIAHHPRVPFSHEAWLWQNPTAAAQVLEGVRQARDAARARSSDPKAQSCSSPSTKETDAAP